MFGLGRHGKLGPTRSLILHQQCVCQAGRPADEQPPDSSHTLANELWLGMQIEGLFRTYTWPRALICWINRLRCFHRAFQYYDVPCNVINSWRFMLLYNKPRTWSVLCLELLLEKSSLYTLSSCSLIISDLVSVTCWWRRAPLLFCLLQQSSNCFLVQTSKGCFCPKKPLVFLQCCSTRAAND